MSVTYTNTGTNYVNAPGVQYNPFTYRGYYYDSETELYYLNSRYYNPEWGRFLNPDSYLNANGDILGFNMFAYCGNNPVCYTDGSGTKKVFDTSIKGGVSAGAYVIIDYSKIPIVGHALIAYESGGVWYKTQVYGSNLCRVVTFTTF